MASIKTQIGQVARQINNAVQLGTRRAANKALAKAKTKVVTDIQFFTGLPKKTIETRLRVYKASKSIPKAKIAIAVKAGIHLSDPAFKPKEKAVKVAGIKRPGKRGRPRGRTFYGVTVKIGSGARELVPGGFLRTVKNGKELVLARKGKAKYPTVALKTDVFQKAAADVSDNAVKFLQDEFDKTVNAAIDYAMQESLASSDE